MHRARPGHRADQAGTATKFQPVPKKKQTMFLEMFWSHQLNPSKSTNKVMINYYIKIISSTATTCGQTPPFAKDADVNVETVQMLWAKGIERGGCKAPRTRGDGLRPVHCFFWNSVGLLLQSCLKMIKMGLPGLLLKPQRAGAEPSQLSETIGILRQCQRRQRLPPLTMPRHCNKSFNELSRWGSCPSDFIISWVFDNMD